MELALVSEFMELLCEYFFLGNPVSIFFLNKFSSRGLWRAEIIRAFPTTLILCLGAVAICARLVIC